jgi:RNA polymerase sigma factor (sigma-70 family)
MYSQPPPNFSNFYKAELPRVLRFLYRQGASWDESWDAAQTAFLEAMPRWAMIASPRAWIRTTAWRAHIAQRKRSDEDLRRAASTIEWLPRPQFSDLGIADEDKIVLEAIASLPPRQRQVMAWHYDGYSHSEIAEILGLKVQNVAANLYQARQRLKQQLFPGIDMDGASTEGGVK